MMFKRRKERNFKIYLTQGRYLGVKTWHYVKVDNMKVPLFQKALQRGLPEVDQLGEILFSGWGENPPAHIRQQVDAMAA